MFKFLKDKLKGAISKISRRVEEESSEVGKEEAESVEKGAIQGKPIKKEAESLKKTIKEGFEEKPLESIKEKEEAIKEPIEKGEPFKKGTKAEEPIEKEKAKEERLKETIKKPAEEIKDEASEKQGFFGRFKEKLATTKLSYGKFENIFSDLEMILMENNVAIEVIDKIKRDLTESLVEKPIRRSKIEDLVRESLKNSIEGLFVADRMNMVRFIKNKIEKPFIIAFFGINGSGKTTTIAKVASVLKASNISCVLAAADTFRAASIEQLQHHGDNLGLKVIRHDYGSDPAAVAFDAIKHAKSKNVDVVLIDTAGRLHSNANLIEEMKKIIKVANPDLKIFVGESITGNDCIEQAKSFNDAVGIDGLILTKADVDEKGGAAISVSYVTKKPIIYLGTGQKYEDLKDFEPRMVVEGLGL